ncbi:MAG: hydrolase, TatD family [Acidobacteria bacterium]|nr:hydrolase, TatD family [Acidobacteriota bacterium]
MLVDSHAHLDMPQFDADREDMLLRAVDIGVESVLTIGMGNPQDNSIEKSLAIAEKHDFVHVGIGVHPHDARLANESYWEEMESWSKHPKVVLWGEIGLDYYYKHSPTDVQRDVFRRQLRMAQALNLPVAIHCREAWKDLMEILRLEWKPENRGGILHSFTGTEDQAREAIAMGFLISFSGMITFKKADGLRQVAQSLAPDEFLVETDAPFLAPEPRRGRRNEPAFVVDVASSLARARNESLEGLGDSTTRNFRRIIGLR